MQLEFFEKPNDQQYHGPRVSLTEARRMAGKKAWKSYAGLVGRKVWLNKKIIYHWDEKKKEYIEHYPDIEVYPWADTPPVPAEVIAEYPNYVLFRILPHLNKHSMCGELSQEYNQTIHKQYLDSGYIQIKPIKEVKDDKEL